MAVPAPRETETFEQAITRLSTDITEAFNRGDSKTCAGFYVEDATVVLPGRPAIKGREAIEAVVEEYAAAGTKLTSVDSVEVRSGGEMGCCTGTYRLDTPVEDGSTRKDTGKFVTMFERQADGSWKAVVDSMIRDTTTGS